MSYTGYSIQTNALLNQEIADRVEDVSGVRGDLAAEVTARQNAINSEVTARNSAILVAKNEVLTDLSGVNVRLTAVEDDIDGRIQNEINAKVNQTAYDLVVADLSNADSVITKAIAARLTDRLATDADHNAKLEVSSANDDVIRQALLDIKSYLDAFSQTYVVQDGNQNVVTWNMSVDPMAIAPHLPNAVVDQTAPAQEEQQQQQQNNWVFAVGNYEFLFADAPAGAFTLSENEAFKLLTHDGVVYESADGMFFTKQGDSAVTIGLNPDYSVMTAGTTFNADAFRSI